MSSSSPVPRNLIIFAFLVPLALLVGYFLATPDRLSFLGVGLVIFVICLPVLLRWHHSLLIFTWNMAVTVFFLPGQPSLWTLIAVASLGISFLDWLLTKRESFQHVPSLTWSLVALGSLTLATAKLTGGIGIRALGGDTYGGKQYILILLAIIGFFALVFKRIEPSKARLMITLFFVSGITPIISNLAYFGGPAFYFLYWVFPAGFAMQQAQAEWAIGSTFTRLSGFTVAGQAVIVFLLQRFGIRGLLQVSKPWRWLLFLAVLFATLLGGFRSSIVIIGTLMIGLFFLEGLYRTRMVIGVITIGAILGTLLVTNVTRLPLAVQRSLSILPIEVDPLAKFAADSTTEWRLKMWSYLLPEVPKHLLKPKGFSLDPTELYLMTEANRSGFAEDIEVAIASGAYHSGPLSLVLGLGIWGVAAFGWFAFASLSVLYKNYRNSPSDLSTINALLLAYFVARLVYFFVVFGHFSEDLFTFTGIVGLSVSLNGGVRKLSIVEQRQPSAPLASIEGLPAPAS